MPDADYHYTEVTITLYPGPEADIDAIHKAAHEFARSLPAEHEVMVDVAREQRASFKPVTEAADD